MSRTRFITFIIGVVALFIALNVLSFLEDEHAPKAHEGVLDLRQVGGLKEGDITLNGEWLFYPGQLLDGTEKTSTQEYIATVPGNWQSVIEPYLHQGAFGYGTYRLKILLDAEGESAQQIALRVPLIRTAHTLFVNGVQIGSNGVVSTSAGQYTPQVEPYISHTEISGSEVNIDVQVANYDFANSGGMIEPIQIGSMDAIYQSQQRNVAFEFGILVVFGFLSMIFGFMHYQSSRSGWIYMSLFFISMMVTSSYQGTRLLFWLWPDLTYATGFIVYFLSIVGLTFWMFMFVACQLETVIRRWVRYAVYIFNAVFIILLFVLPIEMVSHLVVVLVIQNVAVYSYSLVILLRSFRGGDPVAGHRFLAFFIFAAHSLSNLLLQLGLTHMGDWYFIQVFLFSGLFILMFVQQFVMTYRRLKRLSLEMKRVERFKNEFMANISDQMKTPLQALISIADARLQSDHHLTADQRQDLQLLTSVGWMMRSMVDDLLDFSQIREQQIYLRIRSVDFYALVDEVVERVRYMVYDHSIEITSRVDKTLPRVVADEQRLHQILAGVLQHSLKVTVTGTIQVEASVVNGMVEVRVHMQGDAISMEQTSLTRALFESRLDQDHAHMHHNPDAPGLYLVKALTELHHGTVHVPDSASGVMNIILTLPLSADSFRNETQVVLSPMVEQKAAVQSVDNHALNLPVNRSKRSLTSMYHIMIVDDDALNLNLLLPILNLDDYRVTVVRNPEEIMQSMHPLDEMDLIVVNRTLSGISGTVICSKIREQYTMFELPILLLISAWQGDRALETGLAGANDFLRKPVEGSELRVRVRTLLQMKRSVAERIRMELAFLQAQIKPHFLFNTLNSIAALSKSKPSQMNELLNELGNYLRESFRFDNTNPLTPFDRELKLVQSYLHIEKVRFDDWLDFKIEVLTSTNFRVPPLTIQPLVENAVRHGIMRRAEGGRILIRVTRDEHFILITVKDDGVGMSTETLERIMEGPTVEGGIGIRNIERRLKQLFGWGLLIHSSLEQGTEIQVRLPIEKVGFHESDTGG